MSETIRDRLKEGDRRSVGAAASVAETVRGDTQLLPKLLDLMDDPDTGVVARAAHAAMQISLSAPELFDTHIDRLLNGLERLSQWEIGEQFPKILTRTNLSADQTERLFLILADNLRDKSNIVAACSLQGMVDLAHDNRIPVGRVREQIEFALRSDRKALSARARRLAALL
ncbi:hypothetical protein [Hoeflea prorocentri]|uniref:Uncharacterized protein n=1 Tax=Hoeflea prorocentri TaxID=1922333 RepID=A0A9X3UGY9_9HYPH|nr:hypothetical protein [Hoeflea prorocentri]MCY6380665.1 hypothetical protein [Hoeflea prorocentri]MDA5398465.1 hypothetical protein [Hoeflea prorocentri]